MTDKKKRTYLVSSQTALRVDVMNLVSGIEKSQLIDTAVAVFFAAVTEYERVSDGNSHAAIRTIVQKIPDDEPVKLSKTKMSDDAVNNIKEYVKQILTENDAVLLQNVSKNVNVLPKTAKSVSKTEQSESE